jgi:hypothetical protein
MPLTKKGEKIKASMTEHYGAKKGTSVFYASQNKGTITGTHKGGKKVAHMKYGNHDYTKGKGRFQQSSGRVGASSLGRNVGGRMRGSQLSRGSHKSGHRSYT